MDDFCDMTLACQDKQIKTHKLIISSYSPILRNILKLTPNPHPFIYLRRVKYKERKQKEQWRKEKENGMWEYWWDWKFRGTIVGVIVILYMY